MKPCTTCGKAFEPQKPFHQFCSNACRQKSYRTRGLDKNGKKPSANSAERTPTAVTAVAVPESPPRSRTDRDDDEYGWVDEVIESLPPDTVWPPLAEQIDYKASLAKQP